MGIMGRRVCGEVAFSQSVSQFNARSVFAQLTFESRSINTRSIWKNFQQLLQNRQELCHFDFQLDTRCLLRLFVEGQWGQLTTVFPMVVYAKRAESSAISDGELIVQLFSEDRKSCERDISSSAENGWARHGTTKSYKELNRTTRTSQSRGMLILHLTSASGRKCCGTDRRKQQPKAGEFEYIYNCCYQEGNLSIALTTNFSSVARVVLGGSALGLIKAKEEPIRL